MSAHDLIKKTKKILTVPQYKFLKQLAYWSLNSKDYGLKKDGKTWIYNTYEQWAEQLHFSVSTVRRSIKALNDFNETKLCFDDITKKMKAIRFNIILRVRFREMKRLFKDIEKKVSYIKEEINKDIYKKEKIINEIESLNIYMNKFKNKYNKANELY